MARLSRATETRRAGAYFPLADPSSEPEVRLEDNWSEVLGGGMIRPRVLRNAGLEGRRERALGIGPERLAMARFSVPGAQVF